MTVSEIPDQDRNDTNHCHPELKGVILNWIQDLTKEIPDQARNDTLGARNDTLGVRNDTSPLPKKIPRSKKVKKKASPVKNQEGISINLNLNGGII